MSINSYYVLFVFIRTVYYITAKKIWRNFTWDFFIDGLKMRWTFHKMLKRERHGICRMHFPSYSQMLNAPIFQGKKCSIWINLSVYVWDPCVLFVKLITNAQLFLLNGFQWMTRRSEMLGLKPHVPYFTICVLVKYRKITRNTVDSLVDFPFS